MVLADEHRRALGGFIETGEVPHLLLVGSVGSGKTTVSRILINELECSCLELNASDERGIDSIRVKVKEFLMSAGFARWRIAFLDEADQLTPDAQLCLRNIMEQYSRHGRFIMTANHEPKILDAVRSRCQVMRFEALDRKAVFKHARKVLDAEKVEYDPGDVLQTVDDHYPDVRSVINALQYSSTGGKLQYVGLADVVKDVRELLRKGDLNAIRSYVMTNRPDFIMLYRGLFDSIDKFVPEHKRSDVAIDIAEYLYRHAIIADPEVNFAACCLQVMRSLT
jgi:DNA polymerase III delta prime subunit